MLAFAPTCLVAFLFGSLLTHAGAPDFIGPPKPDPFLDQVIQVPDQKPNSTFLDDVRAVGKTMDRPMIFPDGFLEFLGKTNPTLTSIFPALSSTGEKMTPRRYLRCTRYDLCLDLKYDAARNAIVVDFPWHTLAGHRSGRELVETLLTTPMVLVKGHYPEEERDEWRSAFNELLSQPGNFARAWKLRLTSNCNSTFPNLLDEFLCTWIFTGMLKDEHGREHFLVLDYPPRAMSFGPNPIFTYYLFDPNGKWENGGTFEGGFSWEGPKVEFEPGGKRVAIRLVGMHNAVSAYSLAFKGGDIFSHGGEDVWGMPSVQFNWADREIRLFFETRIVTTYDYYLSVQDGKLAGTLWKNGRPAAPGELKEPRLGPLVEMNE